MANELELKTVVQEVDALRAALARAGAARTFRGMMHDRRLDRDGSLAGLDQVLRLRTWAPEVGASRTELTWKGPTTVTTEGYKQREELQCGAADGAAMLTILEALGYAVTHAIDRFVELWQHADASARLEWFPRMDLLLEIEGTPQGIERLIAAAGLDRGACLPDPLTEFGARYAARTRQRAVWAEAELVGVAPGWSDA